MGSHHQLLYRKGFFPGQWLWFECSLHRATNTDTRVLDEAEADFRWWRGWHEADLFIGTPLGLTPSLHTPTGLSILTLAVIMFSAKDGHKTTIPILLHPTALCAVQHPSGLGTVPLEWAGKDATLCAILADQHKTHLTEVATPAEQIRVYGYLCSVRHGHGGLSGVPRNASHCCSTLSRVQLWAPKRPRHMLVTSPLCPAHYRFYIFQGGQCTA